jgi:hypothetical protein
MKRGRIILIAVNFLLIPFVGVFGNALAANLPVVPQIVLWSVGGGVIIVFAVVNVILAVSETRQSEEVTIPPPSQRAEQHRSRDSKQRSRPSHESVSHPQEVQQSPSQTMNPPGYPLNPASEEGQPAVEQPMLLGLAIDVSDSMKKPILDHTGKAIER